MTILKMSRDPSGRHDNQMSSMGSAPLPEEVV